MFDKELSALFLSLVRIGIGHDEHVELRGIDWQAMQALAVRQGLAAVVLDGINQLPEYNRPPKIMLLQWIGATLQGYEQRYFLYEKAVSELAAFYNKHGYKMMLLKGYACSLNWPIPEHRPCGDIDIWQFGKYKEADTLLAKEIRIAIDNSHQHHTVFYWHDFLVENHYDFVNVYAHRSSRELEKLFKELGQDDSQYIVLSGERVYIPTPNLHALFLLRHSLNHFASIGITMCQVLDWAFFVKKQKDEIDWEWFACVLDKYHMTDFFNCLNAICVEDLGFDVQSIPYNSPNSGLKEKVLNDILAPEFKQSLPKQIIPRVYYKLRRWNGNAWKQRLCFNENRLAIFIDGIINHLSKPQSI